MQLYNHRMTLRISTNEMKLLNSLAKRNHSTKSRMVKDLIDSLPNSKVQNRLFKLNQMIVRYNENLKEMNKNRTSNFNRMVCKIDRSLAQISSRDNNLNQISRQVNKAMKSGLGLDCNKVLKRLNPYLDEDRKEYQNLQKYNDKIIEYLSDSYKKMIDDVQN